MSTEYHCPVGGPVCPESICDCFIRVCSSCAVGACDGIHPEFFVVASTSPSPAPDSPSASGSPTEPHDVASGSSVSRGTAAGGAS